MKRRKRLSAGRLIATWQVDDQCNEACMLKETMSPRERWLAVLTRRTPDRVPMDYWATAEATKKLCDHLGCACDEMLERLHIDKPISVGGCHVGPPPKKGEDIWGLRHAPLSHGNGMYNEVVN